MLIQIRYKYEIILRMRRSVSCLLVHPAALVFPSDGFPQFLVADQDDGEGQTRQPPDGAGHGGQLETLGGEIFSLFPAKSIFSFKFTSEFPGT